MEETERPRDPDSMLSRAEVARILSVTKATVSRMGSDGRLPEHKLGRNVVRYRWRDVKAMVDKARKPFHDA